MASEKMDRRVKYTNLQLKDSLIKLMQTTPISKISVKRLCEAADINRSTFYAHYTDPYDLLRTLEKEVVAGLRDYVNQHFFNEHSELIMQALKQVLEYVAKNADLFKVLLSDNGDSDFHKDVMELAQQKTITDLRNYHNLDGRTSEYVQCFVLNGALKLVHKWLEDGMVESAGEMAELVSKLLFQGISSFSHEG